MIEINLRPGLKRKRASASPFAGMGERFKGFGSSAMDPMTMLAVGAWAVALLFLGWTWLSTSTQLGRLEPQLEETSAEHQRFANFVAAKRREELVRDSVLSPISTIRSIDRERYVWAHVMDEVAQALPTYTWLTGMSSLTTQGAVDSTGAPIASPISFRIDGRTVDIQAYTRFLRQLEASPWLKEVTALSAETVVEKERPVTAFAIRATYEQADSAYVRTVPLSQSVR